MLTASTSRSVTVHRARKVLIGAWITLVATAAWIYFFRRDALESELQTMFSVSALAGSALYLLFSCLRGFTLIPATVLIVAGLPFIPPLLLFVLTIIGIGASAASIYYFSEVMGLDHLFENKHKDKVDKVREVLSRHQFPIIIGWSFFPLVPTDLICYVSGTLRIGFVKFLTAVLIGEGVICAIYVFGGDYLMRMFDLRA